MQGDTVQICDSRCLGGRVAIGDRQPVLRPATEAAAIGEAAEPPDRVAEVVIGSLDMALIDWLNDPDDPLEKRLSPFTELIGEVIRPCE
jgi:hypothetical protein